MDYVTPPGESTPFGEKGRMRQRHMGLVDSDGKPDRDAVSTMSRIFAGLFYDDLLESSYPEDHAKAVCDRLDELLQAEDTRRAMLAICSQYDDMLRPLPEPIWWIVGNPALVEPFVEGFVCRLREFNEESGVET